MPPKKRKRGDAAGGEPEPRAPLRVLQARNSAPGVRHVPNRELFTGEPRMLNDVLARVFNNRTRPVQDGDTLYHVLENWGRYTNFSSDGDELEEDWDDIMPTPLETQEGTPPSSPSQSPPESPYSGAGRGFIEPHSLNRMVVRF